MNKFCPFCGKEVKPEDIFCTYCGKKLPGKDQSVTTGQKIKVYILSIILAPFGFYWYFKYRKSEDLQKRKLGIAALIITLVMLVFIVVSSLYTYQSLKSYIGNYGIMNNYYGF